VLSGTAPPAILTYHRQLLRRAIAIQPAAWLAVAIEAAQSNSKARESTRPHQFCRARPGTKAEQHAGSVLRRAPRVYAAKQQG